MDRITTALELVGALAVIAGVFVLLLPFVGLGWAVVIAGAALVGLSALVELTHRRPVKVGTGQETA